MERMSHFPVKNKVEKNKDNFCIVIKANRPKDLLDIQQLQEIKNK